MSGTPISTRTIAPPPMRWSKSSPAARASWKSRTATACDSKKSDIQHPPIGIQHRFLHRLGNRWVREYGVHQFFLGGLEIHRHHKTLDQFRHLRTDHMRAEQLPGFLVEDHFGQTLI